jgi:hypothetical protein
VIRSVIGSTRLVAGALALLLGLTLAAPPAANAREAKAPPAKASIAATAAAAVARMDTGAVRLTQDPPAPASGSPEGSSFFRSGRGAAVLVLLAAGVGYAIYSTRNDIVKQSPCRTGGPGCKFP